MKVFFSGLFIGLAITWLGITVWIVWLLSTQFLWTYDVVRIGLLCCALPVCLFGVYTCVWRARWTWADYP